MLSYLMLYQTLTRAQRAATVLDRAGIANRLIRAPRVVSGQGCSHCIRLDQRDFLQARTALERLALLPQRSFVTAGDGVYEEVLP